MSASLNSVFRLRGKGNIIVITFTIIPSLIYKSSSFCLVTLYNSNYNVPVEKVLIAPEKVAVDG